MREEGKRKTPCCFATKLKEKDIRILTENGSEKGGFWLLRFDVVVFGVFSSSLSS